MEDKTQVSSVKTMVDVFLEKAIEKNASDIHIEPGQEFVRFRFRIDGILHDVSRQPLEHHESIISRIKILANLDISEKRLPQDGAFPLIQEEKYLDVRVSTFPTNYGECAVLRILDHTKLQLDLEDLGLLPEQNKTIERLFALPNGLFLVTGPTGVGKTTTLFSIINRLNSAEKSIVTLEDPIEYRLPDLRQTQIDPKIGLTFALGLRSLFRQNPDIILVGEIRDTETAEIAIQAGISGHLVLSTFHTNDTFTTIVRLLEMEIERFLIASALKGVITQRLVRKICSHCREQYNPPQIILSDLGLQSDSMEYRHGHGCENCGGTGFLGRTGIFEILEIKPDLSELILSKAPYDEIKKKIYDGGFISLKECGLSKVKEGITTIEEIYRVLSIR